MVLSSPNLPPFDFIGKTCANLRQKCLIGYFVEPFYYIISLVRWFDEFFKTFLQQNAETKIRNFPHCEVHTVEKTEIYSHAFLAKISSNQRY